jgi:hypothetical protein
MYKFITALTGVLLLLPAVALADRPAMAERDMQPAPVAEELPPPEMREKQVVTGDALEMQPGETIAINPLDFPRRGMSMDKVKNELGEPLTISDAVGDPPITRWYYADRIVYFEYTKVIDAVQKR